ncbi:PREDICTED: phospholipase SGR2-like isoform X1 [Nelumbo nucifera]|uniref:Phospholipase SGR2-like isoform X1 n=1 Tax=Nelumbo nucifera TaxID=4432 RepID=A0A1U8Q1H7_NELNU|nr:PREDICTED: phospholipase SGR2-like isoform X1 [Nelumbo nucifera]
MLGATVHDVLYYMSPIYCQDIINSVSNQLNRLYTKFIKRNPGYDGKVSIYGHSLGSVLSYDILCHQEDLLSPFPMESMYREHSRNEEPISDSINDSFKCKLSNISPIINNTTLKSFRDTIEEERLNSVPTVLFPEEVAKDPSVIMPPLSDTKESSSGTSSEHSHVLFAESRDFEKQLETSLLEDADGKSDWESSDMHSGVGNVLGHKVPVDNLYNLVNNAPEDTSEKDKVIKLLREEVDALKAKVAEPESKCQGHKEIGATIPKELPSHKLPCEQDETHKSHTPYIKYTKLEFKVDTFFAVGSPLGVFLSLRNIRIGTGKGQEYWKDEGISEEMPACRRMFNIFHPFDPVAYRVEPLICKEYISKRPVIIPYHRGGKRLHIGFQEFREDMAARSQAVMDHLKAVRVKVLTACQSRSTDDMEADSTDNDQMTEERSYGSIMMERLTGSVEDRVDYVLQDKTFQHPYISAIGSHTNYWRDHDTALFILKHLYSDIPEEPNSPELPSEGGSKSQRVPTRRFYQRDDMDEDLPLTFSDTIVVKEFSRKVRKAMKK